MGSGLSERQYFDLEAQRAQYDKAQRWLDEKNVAQYQRIRKQIDSYPLTPYLDYRAFLIDLGSKPPIAVRNFIDSHKEYPFSARIAAPYLDALARSKNGRHCCNFKLNCPMAKLTNAITTTPNCKPESVMRRLKVRKAVA